MSNRIFFDSSLLIEYRKGNHIELFESLAGGSEWTACISQIVVSEYLFHHLAIFAGKSPLSVKTSKSIKEILIANEPDLFLEQFEWLEDTPDMRLLSIQFMKAYNLLPNDALVLAICKAHGIKFLTSLDPDFEQACLNEKIVLINNIEDL